MKKIFSLLIASVLKYVKELEIEIKILLILIGIVYIYTIYFLVIVGEKMPLFTFYPATELAILTLLLYGIIRKKYWAWMLGILVFGMTLITTNFPIIISKFYHKIPLNFTDKISVILKSVITLFLIISRDYFEV